ncbi:LLM class flavin-dependent oxidoreductase [Streptomyces sp. NPDC127033]|uniref:LLM class flavin-dependent oxidoreductase n=1 Tax=Streptomyces sp. NPDC127033 TaxID=3347110 RepID=UPI0036631B0F
MPDPRRRPDGGRIGVYYPLQPRDPRQLAPFARLVAGGHADRLWMGQSLNLDTHQVLAYLLGQGISPPLGVGLHAMPLNHPYQAAVAARSLARLSGKPLTAVFGLTTPSFQAALRGAPYRSPLTAAREYITSLTELLRGRPLDVRGDYVTAAVRLDPALEDSPRVEVGLGVLQEKMARVAADTADAALTWMTPLTYVRDTLLPALGGAEHGPTRLVSVVHIIVRRPGRDLPRAVWHATRNHLNGPHYRQALAAAGVDLSGGDIATARELVDRGVVIAGTAEEIATAVRAYWAAGVDEVVLNPCALVGEGPEGALRDVLEVVATCRGEVKDQRREDEWWRRRPSVAEG